MVSAAANSAVVNMSSVLGFVGIAENAASVASKHALVGLTMVAALEYSVRNVRTNAVGPGFIDTPLLRSSLNAEAIAALDALGLRAPGLHLGCDSRGNAVGGAAEPGVAVVRPTREGGIRSQTIRPAQPLHEREHDVVGERIDQLPQDRAA